MKNRIAKFEKVLYERFSQDWIDTFGDGHKEIELLDIYNSIKAPKRATADSAGYDIYSPLHVILEPGKTIKIPTGLRCKIEPGWFMGVYPRSGLGFKYSMRLNNTVGIIDSDYYFSDNEGHIFVKLINDSSIGKTVDILEGQGMVQAVFTQYGITVDDKADNVRNGGFGSTDNKPEERQEA